MMPDDLTNLAGDRQPDLADSASYLRLLERAVEDRQLDEAGVLEALATAVKSCDTQARIHGGIADDYTLAKCAYLAEAHRRHVLRDGNHRNHKGGGFKGWCKRNSIGISHAEKLVAIGNSPMPRAALRRLREVWKKNMQKNRNARRAKITKVKLTPVAAWLDSWDKFGPHQRNEGLDGLLERAQGSNLIPLVVDAVRPTIAAAADADKQSAA